MIQFTQSTAVLHKYLNDELKYFVCYNFSLRRITEFPENSLSVPGVPKFFSQGSCHKVQKQSVGAIMLDGYVLPYLM